MPVRVFVRRVLFGLLAVTMAVTAVAFLVASATEVASRVPTVA